MLSAGRGPLRAAITAETQVNRIEEKRREEKRREEKRREEKRREEKRIMKNDFYYGSIIISMETLYTKGIYRGKKYLDY